MPTSLATLGYLIFIVWLLVQDNKRRTGVSSAVWFVTFWVVIQGSRSLSAWLTLGAEVGEGDDSSIDRNAFLFLLIWGVIVLKRRGASWKELFANNRWLFLFYLFFALSVLWSVETMVALKRWIKDFGNIVMVFVLLTEANPIAAIKAVFVRTACVVVPLSVLFIKYYALIGRGYSGWT